MDGGHSFSLVRGGPYYALAKSVGLVRDDDWDPLRQSVAFGLVPWCVLMAIAAAERLSVGDWPELVSVLSVHARVLLAVPAYFLAERSLHLRTGRCLDWLCLEGFAGSDEAKVWRESARVEQVRDSFVPELVIAAVVIFTAGFFGWGATGLFGSYDNIALTLPPTASKMFYGLVVLPIFQFFALRWTWRWGLWIVLLRRIARLELRPIPTHPDRQGGLSFLAEPSVGFAYVCFGTASVLAAARATRYQLGVEETLTFGSQVVLAAAIAIIVALGPLLFFADRLWRARFAALRSVGSLADDYTRDFGRRWVDVGERKDLLGTPDIQSMADLANTYDVLARSTIVPVSKRALAIVAFSVVLPFGAFVLTQVPLAELLNEMGATVFGARLFSLPGMP